MILYSAIAIAVLLVVAFAFAIGKSPSNSVATTSTVNTNSTSSTNAILFSNTDYARFSYLISSDNLSNSAQQALSGYNISRTQYKNGTIALTITILADGAMQTIKLPPGYKLYIIETGFGDDNYGSDSNPADDSFAIVNASGYLVQ